jgi:hypothetical protein
LVEWLEVLAQSSNPSTAKKKKKNSVNSKEGRKGENR